MIKGSFIALGQASGALFTYDGEATEAQEFTTPPLKNEVAIAAWALWSSTTIGGGDNKMPIDMAVKIRSCGVLSAALEAKARIAVGKGIRPVFITGIDEEGEEILEFVNDQEINDWMEANNAFSNSIATIRNMLGYGWSHGRFILDNDGKKIARYKTDDVVKCRLGRYDNDAGIITQTFIAADWQQVTNGDEKSPFVKALPMLEEGDEYEDLAERIAAGEDIKEFSMIIRGPLNDMVYYPRPLWYSCYNWVQMAIQVPAMKTAMMNNQMSIKYIITISEKYFSQGDEKWDSYSLEEKNQKYQEKAAEIDKHLAGNDKAFKSIVTNSYVDPASGKEVDHIRIQVLDDKIKDGKLLPDSSAANKEICFALMVNPTILGTNTFGGDYSGGAGSGSDIREAYLLQIMLMEAERVENAKIYDVVKKINGWDKKFAGKKLAFRYPNLILTTLDTGGSTTSTVKALPSSNPQDDNL